MKNGQELIRDFKESPLKDKHYPCLICCGTTFHIVIPSCEDGYVPGVGDEEILSYVLICSNPACGSRVYVTTKTETVGGTLTAIDPE